MRIGILKTAEPVLNQEADWLASYRAWRAIWSEAYQQKGILEPLSSDGFTSQDCLLSAFSENACTAIVGLRSLDLRREIDREDSRLRGWPTATLDELKGQAPRLLVLNGLGVVKDFRRQKFEDTKLVDLMVAACFHFFEAHKHYDMMISNMRNTRGAQAAAYRTGATFLRQIEYFGEPSDLVLFERGHFRPEPATAKLLQRAWPQPFFSAA